MIILPIYDLQPFKFAMQNPFAIASAMYALLQFVLDIDMWAFQTGHKLTLNLSLGNVWLWKIQGFAKGLLA